MSEKITIPHPIRQEACWMADELTHTRLIVTLIPDYYHPTGIRRLRGVEEQNPVWYRRFCEAYPANRTRPRHRKKPDTAIKRQHTLRALHEIANGHCTTEYAQRILPYVEEELEQHRQAQKETLPVYTPHKSDLTLVLSLIG